MVVEGVETMPVEDGAGEDEGEESKLLDMVEEDPNRGDEGDMTQECVAPPPPTRPRATHAKTD